MAYANTIRSAELGLSERISTFVKAVRENRQRRAVYLQTRRELEALTDRDLADLGIHRSMITRIAMEAAYGK